MKRACIAIVDGNTARLYTYEHLEDEQPRLAERKHLVNLAHRANDEDLFSETRPGARSHDGTHGATDDHRDANRAQHDLEFAGYVMDEIRGMVKVHELGHVILVASPRMLGNLRPFEEKLARLGILVDEIQRDLTRLSSSQLHDHLARLNVIEPRARLTFARR